MTVSQNISVSSVQGGNLLAQSSFAALAPPPFEHVDMIPVTSFITNWHIRMGFPIIETSTDSRAEVVHGYFGQQYM